MKLKLFPIILIASLVSCGNRAPSEEKEKEYVKYTVNFEQFDLGSKKMYQSQESGFDETLLAYFNQATDNLTTSFTATKNNRVKILKENMNWM